MEAPKVFHFIGDMITDATDAFVQPATSSLMLELKATALICVTLYIVLIGYAIATGSVESPFWSFVKQCIKIIIITFFALTAEGYMNGVVVAINGLEDGLAQIVSQTKNVDGKALSIYQTLDQSLDQSFKVVEKCFQKADQAGFLHSGSALGWLIAGCIVAISVIYVNVLGGTTIIVAKFSLTVMFALGPLFILCLMFPVTSRFFDNWFSQVMNYVLTIVIMAVIMTFAIKAYDAYITKTDFNGTGDINPISVAFQVCTISGVLGWIIRQAGSMASGLAGGLSIAAMSLRQFAAPVSGAVASAKTVNRAINPQQTRLDMNSGMPTQDSRMGHFFKGNTRFNPAYRQYLQQNRPNTWGKAKGGNINHT